ncbi:hypothetical protein [Thiohalorhabdus methylotrophus]|uniref:Exonuclease n=1 Tax=Thiohalorhabdus methylotrophus TaxID=3242694 RepID=A0ABV4U0Z2_9GAMM
MDEFYSYPIEVAWGDVTTGIIRSYLIDPTGMEDWTDWDPAAQGVHGLSRAHLAEHGLPPRQVAEEVVRQLTGKTVMATSGADKDWVHRLIQDTLGEFPDPGIAWKDAKWHLVGLARGDATAYQVAMDLAWERLNAQDIYAHRAANDVRQLMEVRRILLGG